MITVKELLNRYIEKEERFAKEIKREMKKADMKPKRKQHKKKDR